MSTIYYTRGWRRRRKLMLVVAVLALSVAGIATWKAAGALAPTSSTGGGSVGGGSVGTSGSPSWPAQGNAAVVVDNRRIRTYGTTEPVPIASLAKVMTALVVLRSRPISAQDPGFTITITADDVADTDRRRADGESVVTVVDGEELTERQALQALLLPSANNMAIALAHAVSGSVDDFVDEMNAQARQLKMTSTIYTDPSGYDPGTVSTARDQFLLARAAMRINEFAEIVAEPAAIVPEAGVVYNTDGLLGQDGFVGIKTGSDSAAGGCFMFAARGRHHGQLVYGVVLGQRDGALIPAALNAARRLADSVR
jgi:serine-type D-Ala-D-Ala carboxypeptidase (penicillin-binding protein 5/6)